MYGMGWGRGNTSHCTVLCVKTPKTRGKTFWKRTDGHSLTDPTDTPKTSGSKDKNNWKREKTTENKWGKRPKTIKRQKKVARVGWGDPRCLAPQILYVKPD